MRLTDEQLADLRQFVARARDGRCVQVDADGCRCLVKVDAMGHHDGPCDWSYTRWADVAKSLPQRFRISRPA